MAKLTKKSTNFTSFFDVVLNTTVNKIIEKFGKPLYESNGAGDKVNFEWQGETESGDVFTIYDWKEYRELDLDETVSFHIGGFSLETTKMAKKELQELGL